MSDLWDGSRFPPPVSGTGNRPQPPTFVDIARVFERGTEVEMEPTYCRREDGHALIYRSTYNVVFGDRESGKSWLAKVATAEALTAGERVLIVDLERNGVMQTARNLLALGVDHSAVINPDLFRLAVPEDRAHLLRIVEMAKDWEPAVAVMDSVGELLPMLGKSSNSPDEYTQALQEAIYPLVDRGAAVVGIDHLAKGFDSRILGPTGTMAKGRTATVSLRCTRRREFIPGQGGESVLTINKDRHGGLRAHSPRVAGGEQPAGVFELIPEAEGRVGWRITKPTADDAVSRTEMSGISAEVSDEDLTEVAALSDETRKTVAATAEALRWRKKRAGDVLRVFRAAQATVPGSGTPGWEPGTVADDAEYERAEAARRARKESA